MLYQMHDNLRHKAAKKEINIPYLKSLALKRGNGFCQGRKRACRPLEREG